MNAIPWYKSPVYIGIITSIISQIVVLIGRQDAIGYVEAVFQVIALIALAVAEVKRRTSPIQPIAATRSSAEAMATQTPTKEN
jgi:hypothetical protein